MILKPWLVEIKLDIKGIVGCGLELLQVSHSSFNF
jgi:hypothetical protein